MRSPTSAGWDNDGAQPRLGDAPLDCRVFPMYPPTMTQAAAVITAGRTFSIHFFAMCGTKPLRSGGPAEGGGGGVAPGDTRCWDATRTFANWQRHRREWQRNRTGEARRHPYVHRRRSPRNGNCKERGEGSRSPGLFPRLVRDRVGSLQSTTAISTERSQMDKRSYPLSRVYGLLEPGPVTMVTTASKGRTNVMTMSWHTMIDFEPPLLGCVISDRNYTFGILKTSKECVINIPTVDLASKAMRCGNTSGRTVDKFEAFRLTPSVGTHVRAPLIAECYASLECVVVDTRMVAKYGLFVLEVVKAWVDPSRKNPRTIHHLGRGHFMVAGKTITLPSKKR